MIDRTSLKSYSELEAKGSIGHDQLSVLNIFRKMRTPLTTRECHEIAVHDGLSIDHNGVRSRITELTDQGLLEKCEEKTKCRVTNKTVNRWQLKQEFKTDLFR